MKSNRLLLIAGGGLIAIVALWLLNRGFNGTQPANDPPVVAGNVTPQASGGQPGDRRNQPPLAHWRNFTRPGQEEPPQRALRRLGIVFSNPFDRAVTPTEQAAAKLRLEGISLGDPAIAMISGHIVRTGQTVAGYRVAHIDHHRVSLTDPAGSPVVLNLGDPRPTTASRRHEKLTAGT